MLNEGPSERRKWLLLFCHVPSSPAPALQGRSFNITEEEGLHKEQTSLFVWPVGLLSCVNSSRANHFLISQRAGNQEKKQSGFLNVGDFYTPKKCPFKIKFIIKIKFTIYCVLRISQAQR